MTSLILLKFLSTPSARRATVKIEVTIVDKINFYPRPPRGGRLGYLKKYQRPIKISIHALREEGDLTAVRVLTSRVNFYPRPPRGGRQDSLARILLQLNFYPRPPRGGRLGLLHSGDKALEISIHALREEGDNLFTLR